MKPIFYEDEQQALTHAKKIRGVVIWSMAPNATSPREGPFGYWVESEGGFLRNWEKQVYPKS